MWDASVVGGTIIVGGGARRPPQRSEGSCVCRRVFIVRADEAPKYQMLRVSLVYHGGRTVRQIKTVVLIKNLRFVFFLTFLNLGDTVVMLLNTQNIIKNF